MVNILHDKKYGLASKLTIKCQFCSMDNMIETSSMHKSWKFGPMAYGINSKAVLASLHTGSDQTHLNSALSVMNITSFKVRERETGNAVERIAHLSCEDVTTIKK